MTRQLPLPVLTSLVLLLTGESVVINTARAQDATSPPPTSAPTPGATFEERLAAARTVKTITSLLGIEPGDELEEVREKLDPLAAPADRPKEEEHEQEGQKLLWKLKETDYQAVLVQTDEKGHVKNITGYLRSDKLKPFAEVGELAKAPVLTDTEVAWDVVRPDKPHLRIFAKGTGRKANTISLFIIEHHPGEMWEPKGG